MYKYLLLSTTLFSLCNTLSYAQIGIGTVTPHSSSILDVESATKGFLPPRVTSDASVSSPAEGLIIYDESDNCLNVYNGSTWVNPCSSISTPSTSSNSLGIYSDMKGTDLKFKQVIIDEGLHRGGGIDENNNLFLWGYETTSGGSAGMISEFNGHVPSNPTRQYYESPYFQDHPDINGKAKEFYIGRTGSMHMLLTTDSILYGWGTQAYNMLGSGVSGHITTPVIIDVPAGSALGTKFTSLTFTFHFQQALIAVTSDGKAYVIGADQSTNSYVYRSIFTEIPKPASVTDPSFKYLEVVQDINDQNYTSYVVYLKGSDGFIYALGRNYNSSHGNASLSTSTIYYTITNANNIHKVNFPSGHAEIKKIVSNGYQHLALDADGKAYGWGLSYTTTPDTLRYFHVPSSTPVVNSGFARIVQEPTLLTLPTGVNTIIDIATNNRYYTTALVGDDNQIYVCGTDMENQNQVNLVYGQNVDKAYGRVFNFSNLSIKSVSLGSTSITVLDTNNKYYWMGTSTLAKLGSFYFQDENSHIVAPTSKNFPLPMLSGHYDDEHDFVQPLN